MGFSKQRKKPGGRRSSNFVRNAFFQFSPSGRNEKTPLGSNFTISVSCHHFGWALPSSGKSRVHEGQPIAFKTRFFNFPNRGETKKHPWDRILQFRFHATILGGPYQAAEKAGFTKVVQLRSKRVFSTFPIRAKRKNTLGIEFYNFGFTAQFRVGFSKQRKKPGGRRSSNFVRNAFFQFSPSGRNEKTPLGSNFTISVSCHHFGWALPSSGKSRVHEGQPIAFKTRFFNFPNRGETKKHPWDRILQFRFHATILGGPYQAAEKAGFTKVVQLRPKRLYSTFPFRAKRKNSLGIEFYNFGFMAPFWVGLSKQRKKPGSRRSTNCVQNAFFNFPHRGETKKQAWDGILNFRFYATILGGIFQVAKKTPCWRRSSNCVQNAFFQLSPSGRNEKTALGSNFTISVSCHHFGWAFRSSGKSRVVEGRPITFKTGFLNFPYRVETTKNPLGSNFTISVSCHHFGWAFPSSGKSRIDEGHPIAFKTRFFNFPHRGETKKKPWDRILQFRFYATILGGLFQAAKKTPCWWRSSYCVQNAFFQLSPSGRNEK